MPSTPPWKAARTLAWLGLLLALPYASPKLARFRLLSPAAIAEHAPVERPESAPEIGEAVEASETRERPELAHPEVRELVPALSLLQVEEPPRPIEDPSGTALAAFYEALDRTDRKEPGALTRITHFGDSIVVSDWVTGTLRRRMQAHYGDGGHGFLLIAAPWPGYFHNDVSHTASAGWKTHRIVGPLTRDAHYGLGGVSFRSVQPGTWARFGTARDGELGRRASRFTVAYLAQPRGGELEIRVDGKLVETVSTQADELRSEVHVVEVEDGEHRFELRVKRAPVRAFGVWLEREGPGVVYDAIGVLGARMRTLDEQDDAHFADQLRLRDPHLVVFQFGINESEDGPSPRLEPAMRSVLDQTRAALPEASCLVVGALDRADRRGGRYVSRAFIPKLVEAQRRAAFDAGCAFFDTYAAMGGEGSMGDWARKGLAGGDLAHPSSSGAEVLGTWLYRALVHGHATYRQAAVARSGRPHE